ncbi:SLAP domain-containing protein [Lactobacillus sp. ESL0785]|uniref:SLAP domain-containing protein n=1 Tax=Lactobacillus sp. ESL0785 TaxID=2983232 RepID=UPI0023F885EB|nr:SLAP domain-containing protein [Lactobacillus sp. ESL0785]WEV71201.1 SLAP domain-containing protein [Lactobacillus sp. ESL0785]
MQKFDNIKSQVANDNCFKLNKEKIAVYSISALLLGTSLISLNQQPVSANTTSPTVTQASPKSSSFDPTAKLLHHNAYLYDKNGNRANDITITAGSTVETYGTTNIGNRKFYDLGNQIYLAAGNIDEQSRELARNSYVYNQYGQREVPLILAKGQYITTHGDPVTIQGTEYYLIDADHLVKKNNFVAVTPTPKRPGYVNGLVVNGLLKHKAYIYDQNGNRTNKLILKIGTKCYAAISEIINGQKYYEFNYGRNRILAENIDGTKRSLSNNAYLYNQYGQRIGHKVLPAGTSVRTYGQPVTIKGQNYYTIDNNYFVKAANFN